MILPDVNVLVYAHRKDSEAHDRFERWLEDALSGPQPCGMSDLVLSSFVRIVTNPRIYRTPTPLETALEFVDVLRARPNRVRIEPGPLHWDVFVKLCRDLRIRGSGVSDAWLAALAIESGAEWISTDSGFARFPGLRWRHPFDDVVSERRVRYRTRG